MNTPDHEDMFSFSENMFKLFGKDSHSGSATNESYFDTFDNESSMGPELGAQLNKMAARYPVGLPKERVPTGGIDTAISPPDWAKVDSINNIKASAIPNTFRTGNLGGRLRRQKIARRSLTPTTVSKIEQAAMEGEEEGKEEEKEDEKDDDEFKIEKKSGAPTTCTNCFTQTTPLWRQSLGHPLCNACALFLELNGVDRPIFLKRDDMKKRRTLDEDEYSGYYSRQKVSRPATWMAASSSPTMQHGTLKHSRSMIGEPEYGVMHAPSDENMSLIKFQVFGELWESKTVRASLAMEWDLLGFMKSQYPDNENAKLGSVITLSGTVPHAQATTCSEYAQQTWPSQGSKVIKAYQSAVESPEHKAQGF